MRDRFKFRAGFTVFYTDDNGDDRDIQLFIKGYFSVDCGGAGIVAHSSIIDEALDNTDLSLTEKKSVGEYIECNYCENDEYWFIDNLDFLEQCTGLKDKNGKLIYEGDIVRSRNPSKTVYGKFTVTYDILRSAFIISDGDKIENYLGVFFDKDWCWDIEVIGNIHGNAELLEQSDEQ